MSNKSVPRIVGVNSHPWLAATAPILLLAALNVSQIEARTLVVPVVFALSLATAAFVLARVVVKSWQGAAVMATLGMFCFFAHGHLLSLLSFLRGDTGHAVLGVASCVCMILLARVLRRAPHRGPDFSRAVFPFVAAFFLLSAGQFTWAFMYQQPAGSASRLAVVAEGDNDASAELPDIYYIVLDGYARADRLEAYYDFDNSAFLNHLRDEGFYVAEESCSNYAMTFLSLASSLNMRYLDDEAAKLGRDSTSRQEVYHLIKNNRVGRYLKSKGYRYVHINTGWGGTESSEIADVAYPETMAEFHDVLIGTTVLEPLFDELGMRHAGLIKKQLASLTVQEETQGPKFVFAHLICPHPPFCFDKEGKQKLGPQDESWANREGYVGQVEFINAQMRRIVSQIKQQSERPPVILIQADHGTASVQKENEPVHDVESLATERMPILNAYLVPPGCRGQLYAGITPVNTFRLLLGDLFGDEELPPLEDESYFSWYKRPYDFVEVTSGL